MKSDIARQASKLPPPYPAVAPGAAGQSLGFLHTLKNYVALTKPRVIELLLLVTVPTMVLAEGSLPHPLHVLAVLVGGAASAGAAGAFNCYIDRDVDREMSRTRGRPLATGAISPRNGLVFAWILAVFSLLWFGIFTNLVATALAAGAIFFYAVIYSLLLKRRTPQNIVWGGIAGCFPVLIGWAAVTGTLDWPALVLFSIIFLWTPPHYWPLSIRFQKDYQQAGIPMLGALEEQQRVGLHVVLYAVATATAALLLTPVAGMGWIYTVAALITGVAFVYESYRMYALSVSGGNSKPMRLFHISILYLSLLFLAVAVDPLIRLPL